MRFKFFVMKKISFIFLSLFHAIVAWSQPLPVKSQYPVIIDTDCAIDDLRAISILLQRPEIIVSAIVISDGTLPPEEGYKKIKTLLHSYGFDSVPTAYGKTLNGIDPPWREFNRELKWGEENSYGLPEEDAVELIHRKISETDEKITYIALGPLTNLSELIHEYVPDALRLEKVIWYNESVKPLLGFNSEYDKTAAENVMNSGFRVVIISNLRKEEAVIDTSVISLCKHSDTRLSQIFGKIYDQPAASERLKQGHFRLCDDLVALYLTNAELFDINTSKENSRIRYNQDYNIKAVKEVIDDMIKGNYTRERNIVFNEFPKKREMFSYDVRQIMDTVIARYGPEEWKANVMTDEFHGHLGVFSIVGAKMGIKAREILGASPDELKVVTFSGTRPPYSCLIDGIQVSTGATLGMGTIHIANDGIILPKAIFTFGNRSVQLSLKAEYLMQVEEDIAEGIVKFGLMDDGYWKLIRRNALNYWLNWDRSKIFDVKIIEDSN